MSICKLGCKLKAGYDVNVCFEITESSEMEIYRHPLGVGCMGIRLSKFSSSSSGSPEAMKRPSPEFWPNVGVFQN